MKALFIVTFALLGSCAPTAPDAPRINPFWSQERQDCAREGGRWGRGGLLQLEMCFPQYSDGGKACTASSQCEGLCDSGTRQCTESFRFGCQSYLDDNGEVVSICAD
jgi:hypothetical protein